MAKENAQCAASVKTSRLDKIFRAQSKEPSTHHTRQPGPSNHRQNDGDQKIDLYRWNLGRDGHRQPDPKRDGRDGLQKFDHSLDQVVCPASKIA